jgi:LDH2 family malate/lactate/ureidoglycolate dehydrogenase
MRTGGTRPVSSLVTVRDCPSLTVIDAQDSWAPVAGACAMRTAIEKARLNGVAATLVRNTTFAFALGYCPTIAIEARMIGLSIDDCLPVMAPWGGADKTLGNQAFAVGAPAAIHEYQERGQQLPPGVEVDPEGRPTTDLAMLWGVLTGVLAGSAAFGPHVVGPDKVSVPQSTSLFMLAIDPTAAMPYEQFIERIDVFIDETLASTPEPGLDRLYAPGERGYLTSAQRERGWHPDPSRDRARPACTRRRAGCGLARLGTSTCKFGRPRPGRATRVVVHCRRSYDRVLDNR